MSWATSVKHFSPAGDPGLNDPDGTRMSPVLMRLLDAVRDEVGLAFIATDGYREEARQADLMKAGLSDPSQSKFAHPRGEAADGYFAGLPLLAMFAYASRWPFTGIGLYPYTSLPGDQPILHLDVMDRDRPRKALWIRNRAGVYVYAPGKPFVEELQMLVAEERWER